MTKYGESHANLIAVRLFSGRHFSRRCEVTDQALREWSTSAARRIIGVLLLVAPLEQVAFDIYTPALPKPRSTDRLVMWS